MVPPLTDYLPWLEAWNLTPDGEPFETEYTKSRLLPVRQGSRACMLKLAAAPEEVRGAALMAWWDGAGAAVVLARQGPALLLERATSAASLPELSRTGEDREAIAILCRTVAELHRPRQTPPPAGLPSLATWFRELAMLSGADARLARGWAIAEGLLATSRDEVVLHGDMHHENVLDFGDRGWLAIDPKALIGERAYDYANIFRNPDRETALAPGRLEARLRQVSAAARLDPERLLGWVAAHAALSAAWGIASHGTPAWSLAVLEAALSRIGG
jgi:streptomycin 6-kinase